MRREYEMSEAQLAKLHEACQSVPCMKIGSYVPRNPRENANIAWASLGHEMGFDCSTVKPVPDKGPRFFTADSSEEATP